MLTFGLMIEGFYDVAVLKELIQKCASSEVEVIGRPCGPKGSLMKRFPGFLEEFRYIKQGSNVDKALVIRDADNKDPAELIERMQSKISGRTYPFPVKLLVAVQELEAWLLADESAISAVTGKRALIVQNPENLSDPKEKLKKVLSEAWISYTDEIARKIAANVKVETIESRCPSFQEFREAVLHY